MVAEIHIVTTIPPHRYKESSGAYMILVEAIKKNEHTKSVEGTKEAYGFQRCTTKNRLELTALDDALGILKPGTEAVVYMDNPYILAPILKGWIYRWAADDFRKSQIKAGRTYYAPLKNADLWQRIYFRLDDISISWSIDDGSYAKWMQTQLSRKRKEIEIEHYKKQMKGGNL